MNVLMIMSCIFKMISLTIFSFIKMKCIHYDVFEKNTDLEKRRKSLIFLFLKNHHFQNFAVFFSAFLWLTVWLCLVIRLHVVFRLCYIYNVIFTFLKLNVNIINIYHVVLTIDNFILMNLQYTSYKNIFYT